MKTRTQTKAAAGSSHPSREARPGSIRREAVAQSHRDIAGIVNPREGRTTSPAGRIQASTRPVGPTSPVAPTEVAPQVRKPEAEHRGAALASAGVSAADWPSGGGEGSSAAARREAEFELGAPIPLPFRAKLQARFREPLDGIAAFAGPEAQAAARARGTAAFTVGQRIAFADERPSEMVVAHEVAHAIQQRRAGAPVELRCYGGSPSDPLEREADVVARAVVAGKQVEVTGQAPGMPEQHYPEPPSTSGGADKWTEVKVKAPTTLADRTDGSPKTRNLLGAAKILSIGTVVQTSGKTAVGGAWTEIRLSDDHEKVGWVLTGCLGTAGGAAPAAPKVPQAATPGGGAKAHTTKPTTVSNRPAPDAANVLGDGKVLAVSTPLALTGDPIPIAGDPQKRRWLPIAVGGNGDFAGKAGFILSDCAEVEATPTVAPSADEVKADEAGSASARAESSEIAPLEITASTGPTAAVNTSVDYTLVMHTPLAAGDSTPMVRWFHFQVVDGKDEPESKHGFPAVGFRHSHLWNQKGQFKVIAVVGRDEDGYRATFVQNVVDPDDKDTPLSREMARTLTPSAEDWVATRDLKPAGPKPQGGPLLASANPACFGNGEVTFDLTPLPETKSFFWYIAPRDTDAFQHITDDRVSGRWQGEWRGMAKSTYKGKKVLLGGGDQPHLSFPLSEPGTYDVACEERGADGTELRTSQIVQVVQSGKDRQPAPDPAKKAEFVKDTNDVLAQIADENGKKKAVPVKAVFMAKAGGRATSVTFFIGPKKDGGLVLIDLQEGVSERSYPGATTEACFAAFSSKRSYPNGRIKFQVPARPEWGIAAFDKTIDVEPSTTDKAIAIIGEIAGLAAAPLFFISPPLAAVFQIIATAADMHDAYRTGQFHFNERITIDVLTMAMSLVPLGEGLQARLVAERLPDVAGKVGKYVRIIGLGSGVPGGVMMEEQAIKRLAEISASSKSQEEKVQAMAEALANLVEQTVLLAIVVKHAATEVREIVTNVKKPAAGADTEAPAKPQEAPATVRGKQPNAPEPQVSQEVSRLAESKNFEAMTKALETGRHGEAMLSEQERAFLEDTLRAEGKPVPARRTGVNKPPSAEEAAGPRPARANEATPKEARRGRREGQRDLNAEAAAAGDPWEAKSTANIAAEHAVVNQKVEEMRKSANELDKNTAEAIATGKVTVKTRGELRVYSDDQGVVHTVDDETQESLHWDEGTQAIASKTEPIVYVDPTRASGDLAADLRHEVNHALHSFEVDSAQRHDSLSRYADEFRAHWAEGDHNPESIRAKILANYDHLRKEYFENPAFKDRVDRILRPDGNYINSVRLKPIFGAIEDFDVYGKKEPAADVEKWLKALNDSEKQVLAKDGRFRRWLHEQLELSPGDHAKMLRLLPPEAAEPAPKPPGDEGKVPHANQVKNPAAPGEAGPKASRNSSETKYASSNPVKLETLRRQYPKIAAHPDAVKVYRYAPDTSVPGDGISYWQTEAPHPAYINKVVIESTVGALRGSGEVRIDHLAPEAQGESLVVFHNEGQTKVPGEFRRIVGREGAQGHGAPVMEGMEPDGLWRDWNGNVRDGKKP